MSGGLASMKPDGPNMATIILISFDMTLGYENVGGVKIVGRNTARQSKGYEADFHTFLGW